MNFPIDNNIQLLAKAIWCTGLRHEVIANNIANLDTPGFKARDLRFQDHLRAAFSKPEVHPPEPTLVVIHTGDEQRLDGNTASLDREMVKMSQNAILHNSFIQLLKVRFRMLETAISGRV